MTSDRTRLFPQSARGLQYAADVLQNAAASITPSSQSAGYNLATNILLPFAIEVALKGLLEQFNRNATAHETFRTTGHDLIDLFDRLPEVTQMRISDHWTRRMAFSGGNLMEWPSVRHFLSAHRNSFENWRYIQTGAMSVPYTAAQCLISAVIDETATVDAEPMDLSHACEVLLAEVARLLEEAEKHKAKARRAEEPLVARIDTGDPQIMFDPQWGDARGHRQSASAFVRKAHLLRKLATGKITEWWNRVEPKPGTVLIANDMRALEEYLSEEWLDPEVRRAAETIYLRINAAVQDRGFQRDAPGQYVSK